jgi:hypothetical protein
VSTVEWFRQALDAPQSTKSSATATQNNTHTTQQTALSGALPTQQPTQPGAPQQPGLMSDAASFGVSVDCLPKESQYDPRWARVIALAETCSITPATPPQTINSPRKYKSLDDLVAVCKFLRNLGCRIVDNGAGGLRVAKPDNLTDPTEWERLDAEGKRVGGVVVTMLPPFRDQLAEVLSRLAAEEGKQGKSESGGSSRSAVRR